MKTARRIILALPLFALPLAGLAVLAGGCEQRVVAARGPGADTVEISRPFYEAPSWEKKVFGDPNPPRRRE